MQSICSLHQESKHTTTLMFYPLKSVPLSLNAYMAKTKVVILGGGVAGMSAAHELIERKFGVAVYQRNPIPGGKARSTQMPDSATGDRRPLHRYDEPHSESRKP